MEGRHFFNLVWGQGAQIFFLNMYRYIQYNNANKNTDTLSLT